MIKADSFRKGKINIVVCGAVGDDMVVDCQYETVPASSLSIQMAVPHDEKMNFFSCNFALGSV